MSRWKPWVAGVGLCAIATAAAALDTITFGEVKFLHLDLPTFDATEKLSTFYASSGVTFAGAQALRDGFDTPAADYFDQNVELEVNLNGPKPTRNERAFDREDGTVMVFSLAAQLGSSNTAAGVFSFQSALLDISFSYSSSADIQFRAFSGATAVGGPQSLAVNNALDGSPACSDYVTGTYCQWSVTTLSFAAGANVTSLEFYTGTQYTTLIDDVKINMATSVPEPSTYALMALGLAAVALGSRRRRERVASA